MVRQHDARRKLDRGGRPTDFAGRRIGHMRITPNNAGLGARVEGIDLSQPLSPPDYRTVLRALGQYGVLCFPGQDLEASHLASFGRRFGELEVNVANLFHAPGLPEVMILSNMRDAEGKPLGLNDAGQGWHTDMSYSTEIALANALHAKTVPMRDGRPLGDTQFRNMHAAYDDLPAEVVARLEGRVAIHDFVKFWDVMRVRPGSIRKPLTPEQRAKKPPVPQPIFRTLLQPWLRHVDRGAGAERERRAAGIPVPPPGAGEIPLQPRLDAGRPADVGQHRHRSQRRRRLHAGGAPLHPAGAGNGDPRLRSTGRLT
jgi:alpha-ketoglutarate-dependent taurine dioxygenase